MRRAALRILPAALCWSACASQPASPPGVAASAAVEVARKTTLTGEYAWNGRGGRALEAVFTSTGRNQWSVSFHFEFHGTPHTYTGSAQGSLDSGTLEGRVQNENRRRTFVFSGAFEDDVFRGSHSELLRKRTKPTGTLWLERGTGALGKAGASSG